MSSIATFRVSPLFTINPEIRPQFPLRVQCLDGSDSTVLSSDSLVANGTSFTGEKEKNTAIFHGSTEDKTKSGIPNDGGNGRLKSRVEKTWLKDVISNDLEALWDDGYGTKTIKDYLDGAKEFSRTDGGPPRWFCPIECGKPLKNSPILLFLPGMDGVGLGLTLHHKALGKAFEVWCLHIPVYDRTPFKELVEYVEETVRQEHASSPDKPIYLVGDSFGGCLALAVAARNPKIDLVLVLANPATSFGRSQLQPLFPILEALPNELHIAVPYLLSFVLGSMICFFAMLL
uniref:Catalytic n=1 Tax=Rhizophora mucronata TaxID=61149 RepID=A0A2P2KQN4_RHIMU